jgi:hypothetical protein
MLEGDMSHDQLTRYLSAREYTFKDLWGEIKATVRQMEQEDGCLIFDDTLQEKAWTDENELMCWHLTFFQGNHTVAFQREEPTYLRVSYPFQIVHTTVPTVPCHQSGLKPPANTSSNLSWK